MIKDKIKIEATPFEAFDMVQFFVNTLEMLKEKQIKKGYLQYHENRIKKTFQKFVENVLPQISDRMQDEIITKLELEEHEYNQTKNN